MATPRPSREIIMSNESWKAKRPIDPPITERVLAAVHTGPGFVAFARILGLRIANGQALDALRMLKEIGANENVAYQIVDGWPLSTADQRLSGVLPLAEEAACRLACFIDDLSIYDWPALLKRAIRQAEMARKAASVAPLGDSEPASR